MYPAEIVVREMQSASGFARCKRLLLGQQRNLRTLTRITNLCSESGMRILRSSNNAVDFRRLFAKEPIHCGLLIIVPNVVPAIQRALFDVVLVVGEHLHRDSRVYVEGRKRTESWDDRQTGAKHHKDFGYADRIEFLDSRGNERERQDGVEAPSTIDEDIPF